MLVEDTEAVVMVLDNGKAAKSWLGPHDRARRSNWCLIIQDLENEYSFNDNDLRFMMAVASQTSGAIYNIILLDQSRKTALQFETAAEIARDISSSLDLDELLQKAVDLIRSRFDFYHAGIFLKDLPGEFVVIREATGEAGAQMERPQTALDQNLLLVS
jgi:GAF domain-containing protein